MSKESSTFSGSPEISSSGSGYRLKELAIRRSSVVDVAKSKRRVNKQEDPASNPGVNHSGFP